MSFENDKLNRKKYADFLTEIVSNPEKYKRISDSNAMSIAIDSGWGTGKTTFVNMWKEHLEEQKDEAGKNKFAVIKYNAWKNDFAEEPLESLIYTIINHDIFNKENETQSGIQAGKDLVKYGGKVLSGLIKTGVRIAAGEELAETAGDAVESLLNNGTEGVKSILKDLNEKEAAYKNFYSQYENYYEVIEKIKEALTKVANERKIVIMIDELDRCKPLFAIKLLENIKHILDAQNISFVFALDMEQLSHSIKCIYGQGMDANGYLCRFFDYITKMPKPDKKIYIEDLIDSRPLIRNELININSDLNGARTTIKFADIFYDFSENFNLSLRDIETIYSNFLLLENYQLKNTVCYSAYSLYLFLLILKYKKMEIFNKIFLEKDKSVIKNSLLVKYEDSDIFSIEVINEILEGEVIGNIEFYITNQGASNFSTIVQDANENSIIYTDRAYEYKFKHNNTISLSDILFKDDLKKWNNIKDKSILTYIQENLEFFDFENQSLTTGE